MGMRQIPCKSIGLADNLPHTHQQPIGLAPHAKEKVAFANKKAYGSQKEGNVPTPSPFFECVAFLFPLGTFCSVQSAVPLG